MLLCAVSFTIIRARPACANWSAKLPRSPAKPPGVSSAMDTSPNRSIELPSYTESEKLQIAKRYLVPRQLEEHGLSRQELKLPDATLRRVIHDYTREAGVRQLEREIAALTRKATRRIVSNGHIPKPMILTPESLIDFLGAARFVNETAETIREYGIATGLAWTPVGGEILFIEATRMPGRGNLLLTGSLGDVMKESAQTALRYLRSQSTPLGTDLAVYNKYDIN